MTQPVESCFEKTVTKNALQSNHALNAMCQAKLSEKMAVFCHCVESLGR